MPMHLEIVTAERVVLSDEVDQVNVPTRSGRVGILPNHAPLLSILDVGEMDIIKAGERTYYALAGGFLEVRANSVTILADTVERADEIDEARAEVARQRAAERLSQSQGGQQGAAELAELRRSLVWLQVSQLRKMRRPRGGRAE